LAKLPPIDHENLIVLCYVQAVWAWSPTITRRNCR